jgi:hypothetical protein
MYLRELTQEAVVDDAVIFRDTLNPALWKNNQLKSQIRLKLLEIAKNFINFISHTYPNSPGYGTFCDFKYTDY